MRDHGQTTRAFPPGVLSLTGRTPEELERTVLGVQPRAFEFECPVCRNRARNDARDMPPLCTGPHPSLDEHPPTLMALLPD